MRFNGKVFPPYLEEKVTDATFVTSVTISFIQKTRKIYVRAMEGNIKLYKLFQGDIAVFI